MLDADLVMINDIIKKISSQEALLKRYFDSRLEPLRTISDLHFVINERSSSQQTLIIELENLAKRLQEENKKIAEKSTHKLKELMAIMLKSNQGLNEKSKSLVISSMNLSVSGLALRVDQFELAVITSLKLAHQTSRGFTAQQKSRLNWVGFFFII